MWFRRRKAKSDPAGAVSGLRQRALTVEAEDLALRPTPGRQHVWGVVMETAYPAAVATLVVFGDGTTSLYFSNGGGVIGAGEHQGVRDAGQELLSRAEGQVRDFDHAADTPAPDIGRVRFYVRTFSGTLTAEALEEELGEGRHRLSPVFRAAHGVIAAIRKSARAS